MFAMLTLTDSTHLAVGGSLNDKGAQTNFVSRFDAAHYAELYREHNLNGGHVIALGPGNESEVIKALSAWPNGLQFGGGVKLDNAAHYLELGASHVIVTSALFEKGRFSFDRLEAFVYMAVSSVIFDIVKGTVFANTKQDALKLDSFVDSGRLGR